MVLFDFLTKKAELRLVPDVIIVASEPLKLALVHNHRARRYLLRLLPNEVVRLTIPRRGTLAQGRAFAETQVGWLATQLAKLRARPVENRAWRLGATILLGGEWLPMLAQPNQSHVSLGRELISVANINGDLRPPIEKHLRQLANNTFPARVFEFAAKHNLKVRRVTIRSQRTRWGSCSRRGTISLNWRLIQAPPFVADYIILHELMHLRQMNHSARYWAEVAAVCPDYKVAERWLKQHGSLLK